jgi:hypothetical protein
MTALQIAPRSNYNFALAISISNRSLIFRWSSLASPGVSLSLFRLPDRNLCASVELRGIMCYPRQLEAKMIRSK